MAFCPKCFTVSQGDSGTCANCGAAIAGVDTTVERAGVGQAEAGRGRWHRLVAWIRDRWLAVLIVGALLAAGAVVVVLLIASSERETAESVVKGPSATLDSLTGRAFKARKLAEITASGAAAREAVKGVDEAINRAKGVPSDLRGTALGLLEADRAAVVAIGTLAALPAHPTSGQIAAVERSFTSYKPAGTSLGIATKRAQSERIIPKRFVSGTIYTRKLSATAAVLAHYRKATSRAEASVSAARRQAVKSRHSVNLLAAKLTSALDGWRKARARVSAHARSWWKRNSSAVGIAAQADADASMMSSVHGRLVELEGLTEPASARRLVAMMAGGAQTDSDTLQTLKGQLVSLTLKSPVPRWRDSSLRSARLTFSRSFNRNEGRVRSISRGIRRLKRQLKRDIDRRLAEVRKRAKVG